MGLENFIEAFNNDRILKIDGILAFGDSSSIIEWADGTNISDEEKEPIIKDITEFSEDKELKIILE